MKTFLGLNDIPKELMNVNLVPYRYTYVTFKHLQSTL